MGWLGRKGCVSTAAQSSIFVNDSIACSMRRARASFSIAMTDAMCGDMRMSWYLLNLLSFHFLIGFDIHPSTTPRTPHLPRHPLSPPPFCLYLHLTSSFPGFASCCSSPGQYFVFKGSTGVPRQCFGAPD